MSGNLWTEEKVEELKALAAEHLSGSQIAARMGVTRNVIIGKLHRMGISLEKLRLSDEVRIEREKARAKLKAERERQKYYTVRNKKMPDAPPIVPSLPPYEGALNIPFCDLRPFSGKSGNQCRYIAAEVTSHQVAACGLETLPGASYCPHCTEAMRPPKHTQAERVHNIHMGIRRHQRALRRVA